MVNVDELLTEAYDLLDSGQLLQARRLFMRARDLVETNAEAWLMLGAVDAEAGNIEDALGNVLHALELDPGYEEAHLTLAGIQRNQGKLKEALQSCSKALEIAPDFENAWLMQSALQGILEQYQEAEVSCRRVLELLPDCLEAHVNLGNALKAQGKLNEAATSYRRALELGPDQLAIYLSLANVCLEQDKLNEASAFFSQVLRHQSDNTDANHGMARVCLSLSDPEGAITYCQRSIAAAPGNAAMHLTLCEALLSAGRLSDAEYAHAKIPAEKSMEAPVLLMHAQFLERKGAYQKAFDLLDGAKEKYSEDPDFLAAFADVSRRLKRLEMPTKALERQLEQKALTPGTRKKLHFCLGSLYESNGDYDLAFEQFRLANQLKADVFDQAEYALAIQRLIDAYYAEALSRLPRAQNRSRLPVFIVGMPRSGTTLVEQILSSHSDVIGAGELPYIGQIAVRLASEINSSLPYPECISSVTQDALDEFADSYLARLRQKSETATRVTDKQNGNFLHLGLIQLLLPEARVIHCIRDPMDVCLSLYSHDMGGEATYTRTFENLACYYRSYQQLMSHWHHVLDLPILNFRYEDLIEDQHAKTKELLEFCGLRWDDQCLDFHRNQRVVVTPSHAQVRQPLYRGSIGRWKNFREQLLPLQTLLKT